MKVPNAVGAVLAIILLAGCTDSASPLEASEEASPSTATASTGPGAIVETVGSLPAEPTTFGFYLTDGHKLSLEKPQKSLRHPEEVSFMDPSFQAGARRLEPWLLSQPLREGWILQSAQFDLWFTTLLPQASWSQSAGFFGNVLLWFGEKDRYSQTFSWQAPNVLGAGEVVHVSGEVPLPRGGYAYEAGVVPTILIGLGYLHSPQNPIFLLSGGETPSGLTLTGVPYDLPKLKAPKETMSEGIWPPGTFLGPGAQTRSNVKVQTVAIGDDVEKLDVELVGTSAAAPLDLDLSVLDPAGEVVWTSATPYAREAVRLYAQNFEAHGRGEYTIQITSFHAPLGGSHTLALRTFELAEAAT